MCFFLIEREKPVANHYIKVFKNSVSFAALESLNKYVDEIWKKFVIEIFH